MERKDTLQIIEVPMIVALMETYYLMWKQELLTQV